MRSLLFCLLISSLGFSQSQANWQLYKCENGISIYSRKANNSNIKQLKSVVNLKTSLNSIVALLNDWDSYPEWNYRCGESKTLKVIDATELIHYQTVATPWPINHQDFIINVKLSQHPQTKTIIITSTNNPNYIPPYPNRTRIKELQAKWTLTPLKDGTVQAEYEFFVNPGGLIPAWLLNAAVAYGPYETMLNFKTWVQKPKYQQAQNSLVKELN
ncbi:MAG TPA: START domain-containing protein [Bacteroidia bacterium]|nr:START domain-containing protein [Bacteroidia bacterium]